MLFSQSIKLHTVLIIWLPSFINTATGTSGFLMCIHLISAGIFVAHIVRIVMALIYDVIDLFITLAISLHAAYVLINKLFYFCKSELLNVDKNFPSLLRYEFILTRNIKNLKGLIFFQES